MKEDDYLTPRKLLTLYVMIGGVAVLGNVMIVVGIVWLVVTMLRWMQVL